MNLPQARELVTLMKDHMYETAMRDGLIKDIESGQYDMHQGKSSFLSLRGQLSVLSAPSVIMHKVAEFETTNFRPIKTRLEAASAILANSDFIGDIDLDKLDTDGIDEALLEEMFPEGNFLQAYRANQERQVQETVNQQ